MTGQRYLMRHETLEADARVEAAEHLDTANPGPVWQEGVDAGHEFLARPPQCLGRKAQTSMSVKRNLWSRSRRAAW